MRTYRVGLIGYGAIGRTWAQYWSDNPRWRVAYICDRSEERLELARTTHGEQVKYVRDAEEVLSAGGLDAVCLTTTADARPPMIRRALAAGLHIVAEKPIAATVAGELELLEEIERSDRLVAVNIFNRNAWYHHAARAFIAEGEIGKLGIVRVCHLTAGLMPGEAHHSEGPCFHDCGMHYVDVARWYAGSEYDRWHAQGVRMWGEQEPWFISVHGTFANGVVFQITQGFVYGQMARRAGNLSTCELIGTRGQIHMSHDFDQCRLNMHGMTKTSRRTAPYGGKKQDVMIDLFTHSLDAGRDLGLPSARDSVIASQVSWAMHEAAKAGNPPSIGATAEIDEILSFKRARAAKKLAKRPKRKV